MVVGFLEAIWRESLRTTSELQLNIGSSLPELGMLPLSFAPSCHDVAPGGHAGVGGPTIVTPSFAKYFRLGRAMREVLPVGNGGVAHLFVIYGYQGAENDLDKLALTDQLLTSVLAEGEMCCSGWPLVLVGDLNADPLVIPSLANGMADGAWIDVELAFANGRSTRRGQRHPAGLCYCLPHCISGCHCLPGLPDRWFSPHFAVRTDFSIGHGRPLLKWPRCTLLLSLHVGFNISIAWILGTMVRTFLGC